MMMEFVCPDGTVMRSEHEQELVRAYRYHSRKYHMQRVSKAEALKNIKHISS